MPLPYLKIGDAQIDDALLASVGVVQELNQHWWCTVECRQTKDKRFAVEGLVGKPVTVTTLDEQGAEQIHFTGFVLHVELAYEAWGSYAARLIAVSDSYKSDLTARKEYYATQTLAAVASKVASYSGLTASVNASASKPLNYVQYGETDFSFINRIADDYGCWLRPSENGVAIHDAFQSGSSLDWRDKDGLIDFRVKGTLAPASQNGSHYDHHAMASSTYDQVSKTAQFYPSSAPLVSAVQSQSQALLPSAFGAQRARVMTLADYQANLEGESVRSIGGSITAAGRSRNQQLMAGNTVEVAGTLDAQGTYGLVKVEHEWTPTGYENAFVCTPWKNYRNPRQPGLRAWYGVVPARVVAHDDPKKMGRVKVRFFWQADGSTHWARHVSPHAGPGRGFMFMPEVGDEVAVLFEDGDAERPVIVGSVWNGMQQAPRHGYHGEDIPNNDVKRIVTKSGNRIQIADLAGNEAITIATPNHNSLTFSEKHTATGRPLIALSSTGDIVLSAPEGRVHIQSKYYSREVGESAAPALNGAAGPPGAGPPAGAAHAGGLGGFASGLYDNALKPLGHMLMHPIDTIEGIGHAAMHPVQTAGEVGSAVKNDARGVMSGNSYAMGAAVGTLGTIFVPGLGEAGAAEDAARLGQVGELGAGASRTAEMGEAGADVAKTADISEAEADVAKTIESEPSAAAIAGEGANAAKATGSFVASENAADGLEGISKEADAIDSGRLPDKTLTAKGWPDLPGAQAKNFVSADPVTLNQGDTIYRIIDDPSNAGGGYWARDLPSGISEWRSDYAVKPEWNGNGLYAQHMVEEPLNVWEGPAASQGALPGGNDQIWMAPGTLKPTVIKPTGW